MMNGGAKPDGPAKSESQDHPAPSPRRRWALFLGIGILAVALAFFFEMVRVTDRGHVAYRKNERVRARLRDLVVAIELYRANHGTYPALPGKPLVADTRVFVSCLRAAGAQHACCSAMREEEVHHGELLSAHGKPFYYTFPAEGVPGPDGKVHPEVAYHLWTWGSRSEGPEAAWEINNWAPRD